MRQRMIIDFTSNLGRARRREVIADSIDRDREVRTVREHYGTDVVVVYWGWTTDDRPGTVSVREGARDSITLPTFGPNDAGPDAGCCEDRHARRYREVRR